MSMTVTSKGQVTIPKRVRDHLAIAPGDAVEFELTAEGRVMLVKAGGGVEREPGPFTRIRGSATARMSTDEIMALTRQDI